MSEETKEVNSESQDTPRELDSVILEIMQGDEESQVVKAPEEKGQPNSQAQPEQGNEQPDAPYEIQEDEYKGMQDLGYSDDDLNEFSREDVNNILQTKTEKPKTVEEEKGEASQQVKPEEVLNLTITPEMAKEFGYAKSLIGKPISEAFKTIDNQNKFVQKLQQDYNSIKGQLTNNEKDEADELLKDLLKTDPIDLSPEDFKEKITKLVETVKNGVAVKQVDEPAQEKTQSVNTQEFFAEVQKLIPENVKAEEVAEKWWASLPDNLKDLYSKTSPQVVIEAIKGYTLVNLKDLELQTTKGKLSESEKDKDKKIRIIAAERARKAISQASTKPVKGSKFQIVSRKTTSPYEGLDSVVKEILEDAEE